MRILHLTIMLFCQVLLASFILYSASTLASPVIQPPAIPVATKEVIGEKKLVEAKITQEVKHAPAVAPTQYAPAKLEHVGSQSHLDKEKVVPGYLEQPVVHHHQSIVHQEQEKPKIVENKLVVEQHKLVAKQAYESPRAAPADKVEEKKLMEPVKVKEEIKPAVIAASPAKEEQVFLKHEVPVPEKLVAEPVINNQSPVVASPIVHHQQPQVAAAPIAQPLVVVSHVEVKPVEEAPRKIVAELRAPSVVVVNEAPLIKSEAKRPLEPIQMEKVVKQQASLQEEAHNAPLVKGGQGPLHLLAATLCSYQPDKPVADDTVNLLYSQRAALRKSLFEFMSLKFTNLEKFSSRLHPGLEVMPSKPTDQVGVAPSHGWPVVGKCTAHDLKLMAEAAWCETNESPDEAQPAPITSNKHLQRASGARFLPEPVPSEAVSSKILHVNDVKYASIVEGPAVAKELNITQQQLAAIQGQASPTRECRRNALVLTKALFNHLAEDQSGASDSWPKLYSQISQDDCARKRMIDVVTALSGFRTETGTIRRDNVEFAFAMDDLRAKVLDSEVNVPLTFDKQFIEVEQFLQQSVKLMLSNIDPDRARLTSMRYRSLMSGPVTADDQCVELHQRLLAKNYPTDCNPNQFGQLPDVLRMAANSLELWSIENELSKQASKIQEYPVVSSTSSVYSKSSDVNQCIANLVSS